MMIKKIMKSLKTFVLVFSIFISACNNKTENNPVEPNLPGNWEAMNTGTSSALYDVKFINNSTGWAAGESGLIIRTTDGGLSWVNQYFNNDIYILGLDFFGFKCWFRSGFKWYDF